MSDIALIPFSALIYKTVNIPSGRAVELFVNKRPLLLGDLHSLATQA